MLSDFSCLVCYVKILSCSAPGCSNRSDKDPKFAVYRYRQQNVGKNVAAPASLGCMFFDNLTAVTKHLRMSASVMNTSQRIATKSLTDTKC